MKIDLDDLKHLYRGYIAEQRPGKRPCPPESELFSFFEPATPRRRKVAILHHVTSCSNCAELFELLFSASKISASKPLPSHGVLNRKGGLGVLSPSLWRWAAALFGFCLIITSVLVIWQDQGPAVHRNSAESLIRLIRPVGRIPAGSVVLFEWSGTPETDFYRVDLFDDTLLRIWQSPSVEKSPLRLPTELIGPSAVDRPYFWMVTAISQDGRIIESPLQKFVATGSSKR